MEVTWAIKNHVNGKKARGKILRQQLGSNKKRIPKKDYAKKETRRGDQAQTRGNEGGRSEQGGLVYRAQSELTRNRERKKERMAKGRGEQKIKGGGHEI